MVSIIIPARPGQPSVAALDAAKKLNYPKEKLEVIVARGKQPSVQRNTALRKAQGSIIYFLDDDSCPRPETLNQAVRHFEDPSVALVGGPNLCPPEAPLLQQAFAVVTGSWLAFGPSCARYRPVGKTRATSEKELILCNMLARRDAVLELGGFDESLYPNEENALMDDLQKKGKKLIYDPELIVERLPRPNFTAFFKMLLNYGRGRAEQFRLHPTLGSLANFVPPLFCLYLVSLPLLAFVGWLLPALLLLALYGTAVLIQTLVLFTRARPAAVILCLPLIILTHVGYGLGFWWGLFKRIPKAGAVVGKTQVELQIF